MLEKFAHVFPAMVTPMNEDGSFNYEVAKKHADWMMDNGCLLYTSVPGITVINGNMDIQVNYENKNGGNSIYCYSICTDDEMQQLLKE